LLEKARLNVGGVINPIDAFRSLRVRNQLIKERGKNTIATGL
jgi:L-rhamnose isomerase/sugar isomerase